MTTPNTQSAHTPNAAAGLTKLTEVIKPLLVEVSAEQVKYIKEYLKEETDKLLREVLAEEKKSNDKLTVALDVISSRLDAIDASIADVNRSVRNDESHRRKVQLTLDSINERLVGLEKQVGGTSAKNKVKSNLPNFPNVRYRDNGPGKNMFQRDDDFEIECD